MHPGHCLCIMGSQSEAPSGRPPWSMVHLNSASSFSPTYQASSAAAGGLAGAAAAADAGCGHSKRCPVVSVRHRLRSRPRKVPGTNRLRHTSLRTAGKAAGGSSARSQRRRRPVVAERLVLLAWPAGCGPAIQRQKREQLAARKVPGHAPDYDRCVGSQQTPPDPQAGRAAEQQLLGCEAALNPLWLWELHGGGVCGGVRQRRVERRGSAQIFGGSASPASRAPAPEPTRR